MKLFVIGMACILILGYFVPLARSQEEQRLIHSGIFSINSIFSMCFFILNIINNLWSKVVHIIDAVSTLMPYLYLIFNDRLPPRSIYYFHIGRQVRDLDLLEHYIEDYQWAWTYREDYWDCSEMSAYLEWFLENKGFHTIFCFDEVHMWLCVEMDDGWIAIESTARGLVWGEEEWMWNTEGHQTDYYYSYEAEDIYELHEGLWYEYDGEVVYGGYPIDELDWWGPYCGGKAGGFIIKMLHLDVREAFSSLFKNPVDTG